MTTRAIRVAAILSLIAITATTATLSNPRATHAQGVTSVCDPNLGATETGQSNAPSIIAIEPHPLGFRIVGCIADQPGPGGYPPRSPAPVEFVNLYLTGRMFEGQRQTNLATANFDWSNLRGTTVVEISPDILPDGTEIGEVQVWAGINTFDPEGNRTGSSASQIPVSFQNIVYTRPGRLDILPTYDDVSWPGADFVRIMAQQGGVPARIVWVVIGFGLAFVALVAVGGATKSPLIGGIAGAVVLGLITTPTVGIATIGMLLIFLMCVAGVLVIGGFN